MKHLIVTACAALLSTAFCAPANGQASGKNSKEEISRTEKVVLQLDEDGKTEIQIKDGVITINGEEIMTIADATNGRTEKTIIIEGAPSRGGFDPFGGFGQSYGAGKAALGVQFEPGTEEKGGALIKEVLNGSAAEKAGLKSGDLITKVDEANIRNSKDLVETISTYKPGDDVEVTYRRGSSRSTTVKAKLGTAPGSGSSRRSFRIGPDGHMQEDGGGMPNGMNNLPFSFPQDFGNLFGEMAPPRPKLGITGEDRSEGAGVIVKDVHEGSPADKADLKKGDIITAFAGEDIESLSGLQALLRKLEPGSTATITYSRDGIKKTREIKLPKPTREEEL